MDQRDPKLLEIWNQKQIPVVFRGGGKRPLMIRLPFGKDNRQWLQEGHRTQPEWVVAKKYWAAPKSWFENLIKRALVRYGRIYVVQPFRASQKCAPSCWNAVGVECECSCMGENHGSGEPLGRWHVVSETFAIRWDAKEYACRLIVPA